jgi:DNA (cytosine-5)-methyltransferase 1
MSKTLGTFCSGIGSPELAAESLGWSAKWSSEIDPFASAVLAARHPSTVNLGDMTKLKGSDLGRVDVICAGTPCQSFSVAGLRKGMADPRGNLALVLLGLVDQVRPRWLVWENVPGVLSSSGGRDFGAFLGGLGQLGYGWAYRVLDAQYVRVDGHEHAVPQRRRRVFVVGCLGGWIRAAAVLFERNSLSGNPAPRREAGTRIAGTIAARTRGGGGLGTDFETDGGLIAATAGTLAPGAHPGSYNGQDAYTDHLIAHTLKGEGHDASEDGTGRGVPIAPVAYTIVANGNGTDPAGHNQGWNSNYILHDRAPVAIPFDTTQITSKGNYSNPKAGDPCHPLAAGAHAPTIAYTIHGTDKTANVASPTDVAGSLRTKPPGSIENSSTTVAVGPMAFGWNKSPSQTMRVTGGACDALQASPCSNPAIVTPIDMRQASRGEKMTNNRKEGSSGGAPGTGIGEPGDPCPSLSISHTPAVAYQCHGTNVGEMGTLRSGENHTSGVPFIPQQYGVRRLTPLECERLMGFPDGYSAITYRGKAAADGPRYRAIGNSIAVNVMRWVLERIQMVDASPPEDAAA